jgi:hypothetical protein
VCPVTPAPSSYSANLRSLGLADHFIALDIQGGVFLLLAISRLLWLCLTGAASRIDDRACVKA